jgi:SAM-dependent methyltransferase
MSNSRTSLSISVRRHFVDKFFFSHANLLKKGMNVLDIGGKKKNKRGLFDIGQSEADVKYVNIDRSTEPDIVADAREIPVPDEFADVVVMGELLEHVPDPFAVLKEAYRLLKPGGRAFITVPFMYPIHADPYDFGRYTDYYWQAVATKTGFTHTKIERQGTMFAVIALMVQHFFRAKNISWRPIQNPLVKFFCQALSNSMKPLA